MIRSGKCERDIFVDAQAVPSVYRLSVNGISRDTEGGFLCHQRRIVSPGSVSSGHRRRDIIGAGVPGINSMVFKHKRLVTMFLRPKRTGDLFAAVHYLTALIVQAESW